MKVGRKQVKTSVHDFATEVAWNEGGKKQVDIAQIKEILKVTNELLSGGLYRLIRNL